MSLTWISISLAMAAAALGISIKYLIPTIKEDNPVEEMAEEIIKENIGIDVDITPDSPENK